MHAANTKGLTISVRSLLSWGLRGLQGIVSSCAPFLFLSPPFRRRQLILNKRSHSITAYTVRDNIDLAVLRQVFDAQHYEIAGLTRASDIFGRYQQIVADNRVPLIIDCGANIGASANYFSERFPKAKVVAIEPEAANFELLKAHCRSDRIDCINAAVASTPGQGKMVDPGLGSWGFRVEEAVAGSLSFVTINGLLSDPRWQTATPFIIKVDIEGFERDLFAANTEWIDRFPLLIVELHDYMFPREASSGKFLKVISLLDRDFVSIGENIFSIANFLI
jgi:FkbM family methyltransferase